MIKDEHFFYLFWKKLQNWHDVCIKKLVFSRKMPDANAAAPSNNGRFLLGAAAIILLLTVTDFMGGSSNEVSAEKSDLKFASKFMGPSIKFAYW